MANLLKFDPAAEAYKLQQIKERLDQLDIDPIIKSTFNKIILSENIIRIEIDTQGLRKAISEQLLIALDDLGDEVVSVITQNYILSTSKRGTIMIDAPQSFLAKDDPFNMADYKIKNWVKGTVWRDMHFQGKTIAQIAKSESVGLSYVHRLIDQSFDVR